MRVYNTGTGGGGSQYHPVLIMWPDSDQWPQGGEDDYVEFDVGMAGVETFIHHPNTSSVDQHFASKAIDPTVFHNYAIERGPARVKGWIDGVEWFNWSVAELNGQVPGPMHPTIQLDNFGGSEHRPANQDVAWIRIYGRP